MLVQTILVGLAVLVVWKIAVWTLWYANLCKKLRKLPQKPGHWLFGNMKDLTDARAYINTVRSMTETQGARMYCLWVGPFPFAGVAHPDTFKQLLPQTHNKARGFADGYKMIEPWLGDGLLLSYGKKWKRNRQLLTPAFHFEILKGYNSVMNNCASVMFDKLSSDTKGGHSIEMRNYVGRAALDVMMKCTLSYTGSMQDESESHYIDGVQELTEIMFTRLLNPLLMSDFIFGLTAPGRRHDELIKMLHAFTGTLIDARKKEMSTQSRGRDERRYLDFLDVLLTAKDDKGEGLSDQDIKAEVDTFLFEGHDTTSSAISWAVYCLGKYPEMQEKAYREVSDVLGEDRDFTGEQMHQLPYLTQFIKEAMRYYYPVPMVSRQHSDPITIDGIEIPVGPRVDINIAAIHHHPDVWKEPKEFRPERFDPEHRDDHELFGYIPFSAGLRNCIGQVFAMNEIKISLGKLLKRFTVSLDTTKPTEPSPCVVTGSTNGIWVFLKERTS